MGLTLAIPSKGRLREKTLETFKNAGLSIIEPKNARSYRGSLENFDDVEVAFLSASEIARELTNGNIALGVTGEDLAREAIADADKFLEFSVKLGFGQANVIVAVPQSWVDVDTMADLDDVAADFRARHQRQLRIATKYFQLTRDFFAGHGIAMYRIVESLGATEGAPAAGQADIIVDITSTGSTLKANHLKILEDGVILQSEANLIVSKKARLSQENRKTVKRLVKKFV